MALKRTIRPPSTVPRPTPVTGRYFLTASPNATSTNSTLGIGTLKLVPWVNDAQFTADRIGAEVTTVGDAGSKYRLGIYADTGNGYPGALVIDAGQIAGDSATTQELTISQLLPAGLYWIGGVVQTVTTTQPTIRICANWAPTVALATGTSLPSSNVVSVGFQQTSVTAALPSTFSSTVTVAPSAPRVFLRVG